MFRRGVLPLFLHYLLCLVFLVESGRLHSLVTSFATDIVRIVGLEHSLFRRRYRRMPKYLVRYRVR